METNEHKDIKKIARGSALSFAGAIVGRGGWFLYQVIAARFLGVEAFGLYMLAIMAMKITDLISRLGLHTGSMRFVALYRKNDQSRLKGILISSFCISFGSGIFLGLILYLFAGFLAKFVFHKPGLENIIIKLSLSVPFMSSMMVVANASQGFHTTKYAVLIRDIIQPTLNLLFISLSIFFGLGLVGIIYGYIASYSVALLVALILITKLFPEIKDKTIKSDYQVKALITYSIPLLFSSFLYLLISWMDTIMLGIMKTSQDVGIFKAASEIPLILPVFLGACNSIYAPIAASLYQHGEFARLNHIFKTTTRWAYTLALPVSLILIFSAKEILMIFGSDFVNKGIPVVIIFTLAQFINSITGGVGFTLIMTGKQKIEFYNSIGLFFVNFTLNLILIPSLGCMGAAIATATSVIFSNILRLMQVYIFYKMQPYGINYLKTIVPAIMATVLLLLTQKVNLLPIGQLMLNVFIVLGIFLIYTRFTGVDEDEQYIWNLIKQKFAFRLGA